MTIFDKKDNDDISFKQTNDYQMPFAGPWKIVNNDFDSKKNLFYDWLIESISIFALWAMGWESFSLDR